MYRGLVCLALRQIQSAHIGYTCHEYSPLLHQWHHFHFHALLSLLTWIFFGNCLLVREISIWRWNCHLNSQRLISESYYSANTNIGMLKHVEEVSWSGYNMDLISWQCIFEQDHFIWLYLTVLRFYVLLIRNIDFTISYFMCKDFTVSYSIVRKVVECSIHRKELIEQLYTLYH